MPLLTIGPRAYTPPTTADTITFTPLSDRAAVVHRVFLTAPSAADTWVLSCLGQELARFDIEVKGSQQLLSAPSGSNPNDQDIFTFARDILGIDLTYPVPQGGSLTLTSVGGATADLAFEYSEENPGTVNPSMMNHPLGNRFLVPIYLVPPSSISAAGAVPFASQISADFVPSLINDTNIPEGFTIVVRGIFLEGGGVNTFSGSADHQSVTEYLALTLSGQSMWTRSTPGGIIVVGTPSATGSGNTVIGADLTAYPPFQDANLDNALQMEPPQVFRPGQLIQLRLGISGDLTGNADYSDVRQLLLCEVLRPGA